MNLEIDAIALFHADGRMLETRGELWAEALNLAMANGWKPAGTTAPPRHWTAERTASWDGRYLEALGQCVQASDAARLAEALACVVERGVNADFVPLSVFPNSGSFLICPLTTELREALRLMPHVEGPGPQRTSQDLRIDLENLRRSLSGYSNAPDSSRKHLADTEELRVLSLSGTDVADGIPLSS